MSYPRYEILSKEQDVFTEMAFYYRSSLLVTIDEVTQPVVVDAVTGEFFDVLGVPARNGRALNRALNEDDDTGPL